jgi:hypothetical protein
MAKNLGKDLGKDVPQSVTYAMITALIEFPNSPEAWEPFLHKPSRRLLSRNPLVIVSTEQMDAYKLRQSLREERRNIGRGFYDNGVHGLEDGLR